MIFKVKAYPVLPANAIVLLFLGLSWGCSSRNNKAEAEMEKLAWLKGTWQQNSEAGTLTESWKQEGTGLTGKTYLINGKDTVFSEKLNLELKHSEVFYTPVLPKKNKGKEVFFKLISSADNRFVFENRKHDFPQRIIYRQLPGDSLVARIEGKVKGKLKFEEFKMKKVN